jgi:tRNA modification GTPase
MNDPGPRLCCSRLTARGEAGIALFRVRGAAARSVLAEAFRPRGAAPLAAGQIRVGWIVDQGRVLDDAVVRLRDVGGGIEAELSIHGSVFVADRFEAMMREAGAEPLDPSAAWELGGARFDRGDRIWAEARDALLGSFSDLQVAFFLGAIEGRLGALFRELARSAAALSTTASSGGLLERTLALTRRAAFGLAMAEPPRVVLAGLPNSGKSTLFNALLGESRAIVSPEPGTTRDVVSEPCVIAGLPFRIADSAGLRESADLVEEQGVARARRAAKGADIVIVLIDPESDLALQARIGADAHARRIIVLSKSDGAASAGHARTTIPELSGALRVSGRTKDGIAELRSRIVAASAFGGPADIRQPAPFSKRHVEGLTAAAAALTAKRPREAADALLRVVGPA